VDGTVPNLSAGAGATITLCSGRSGVIRGRAVDTGGVSGPSAEVLSVGSSRLETGGIGAGVVGSPGVGPDSRNRNTTRETAAPITIHRNGRS
jgi:hypothetical protein